MMAVLWTLSSKKRTFEKFCKTVIPTGSNFLTGTWQVTDCTKQGNSFWLLRRYPCVLSCIGTELASTRRMVLSLKVNKVRSPSLPLTKMHHCVEIRHKYIKNTVDGNMPSYYLPSRTRTMYVWYIQFAKLVWKEDEMLSLLRRLRVDLWSRNNFGTFLLDISVLHIKQSDKLELILETAHYFINNSTKISTFHAEKFYNAAKVSTNWDEKGVW